MEGRQSVTEQQNTKYNHNMKGEMNNGSNGMY